MPSGADVLHLVGRQYDQLCSRDMPSFTKTLRRVVVDRAGAEAQVRRDLLVGGPVRTYCTTCTSCGVSIFRPTGPARRAAPLANHAIVISHP